MASKEQMYCCLGFYLELFLFGWLFSKMNLEIDICRSRDLTITTAVTISVTLRKVFLGLFFFCLEIKNDCLALWTACSAVFIC